MKTISRMIICLCVICFAAGQTNAQVAISVRIGPPELPVYVQPECPVDGYLWEPGYWAYDDADGYYWVPGVWVAPPDPGYFWTPPYWGYAGGFYGFHRGYWGLHVGYYGGIDYGFGYGGYGFTGGRWAGNRFSYNTAVMHVNRTVIHNTYIDRTAVHNVSNRKSFNGPGGVTVKPRANELAAMRERHIEPTSQQALHERAAAANKSQFAKVNHGRPVAAAMDRVQGKPFNTQGHGAPAAKVNHSEPENRAPKAAPRQQRTEQQRAPQQEQQRSQQQEQRRQQPAQQRMPQEQRAPQQRPQQQRMPQEQHAPQQRQQQQRMPQEQRAPQQQRPPQQQQQRPPQQGGGNHEHHG